MTTTETASPPTSELAFVDRLGKEVESPSEWEPAYLVLPVGLDAMADVAVVINGRSAEVTARSVGGRPQLVAIWDRSGPGWYDIDVTLPSGSFRRRVRIAPGKLAADALAHMLTDLEARLPVSLAVALRDAGARIGIKLIDPAEQTLASEVARLRRAVDGVHRPGLARVLEALADDPHRMLMNVGEWVRRDRARRPGGADLVRSLWRAGNLEDGRVQHVIDRRVEHTVDLYENRLIKAFADEVERRLRFVHGVLSEGQLDDLSAEVAGLLQRLVRARRRAGFLGQVGSLRVAPDRVTMVLLKRKEYRAAYEAFLEFRRRTSVHLDEPAMAEPLRNVPYLYQTWGTLLTLEAVLAAAVESGFTVVSQRLVWPQVGGMYVKVLKDNRAAIELSNGAGDRLRVYPERSYSSARGPLHSVSFTQRPDVALGVC